jgi:putative transposase
MIYRELVLDALTSVVMQRRCRGIVFHSNQGSPHQTQPVVAAKAGGADRSGIVLQGLKKERFNERIHPSRDVAQPDITDYIDTFFNRSRRHTYLGAVNLEQFTVTHKGSGRRGSA